MTTKSNEDPTEEMVLCMKRKIGNGFFFINLYVQL